MGDDMTNNTPKRFDPVTNGNGAVWMEPDDCGDYVLYSDYTAVCKERDDLIAADRDHASANRGMKRRLEARTEAAEAEVEKWKQAFATQSRKLQSVLHIEGVRKALEERPMTDNVARLKKLEDQKKRC